MIVEREKGSTRNLWSADEPYSLCVRELLSTKGTGSTVPKKNRAGRLKPAEVRFFLIRAPAVFRSVPHGPGTFTARLNPCPSYRDAFPSACLAFKSRSTEKAIWTSLKVSRPFGTKSHIGETSHPGELADLSSFNGWFAWMVDARARINMRFAKRLFCYDAKGDRDCFRETAACASWVWEYWASGRWVSSTL